MKTVTALVPMKAHSERIPDKNVRPLCGKPLFHWIMEALAHVPRVAGIVVNTDSERIAEQATERFGAMVHWRPPRIQGDFVSMNRIIENDLEQLPEVEHFLQTHATNPNLRPETISDAIETFFAEIDAYDSLMSVTEHYARFFGDDGRPINHDPGTLVRTQDLRPLLQENSCLYLFSRGSFVRAGGRRVGQRPRLFPIPRLDAVDIDDPEDWRLAEGIMRTRLSS